jgi:endonuclease/exonuclease/phosphatase family metal-dependent hydrolase
MNVWAMFGWPEIFKQVGVLLPLKFTTIYTSFIQVKCLVCLFLMFTSAAGWANLLLATKTAGATELKLLVYNTHGLPAIFAGDKPSERFPKIGNLTQGYDLSLLQEDFAHHDLLVQHVKAAKVYTGADENFAKCLLCSNSGLTVVSNLDEEHWEIHTVFEPFIKCSGWLSKSNDCFAQKGFQLIDLNNSRGNKIYIVNTHLDAGRHRFDREVRATQLEQIAQVLEDSAEGSAVLLAGDLNLDWDSPADRVLLQDFVQRLDLVLAQKGGDKANQWRTLDYIYYRSSAKTKISTISSGEVNALSRNGESLSDHPALFLHFEIH